MLFWLMVAVLLLATLAALLLPLYRGRDEIETRGAYDANVFKDQLKAIDAELAEGLIDAEDADAARIEISRKLLAAADQAEKKPKMIAAGRQQSRIAMMALGIGVPAIALSLYALLGSPGSSDMPLYARLQQAPQQQKLEELIARAEMQLQQHPDDGRGWEIMGPVYLRHGLNEKAIAAYKNAIRLLGSNGERLAGLVDAMIFANDGVVSDETVPVIKQAIAADPDQPKPQFWLALYDEQGGRADAAMKGYTQLLERSASDQPWRQTVLERLNGLRKQQGLPETQIAGLPPAAVAEAPMSEVPMSEAPVGEAPMTKGPSAEDVKRASEMSAEDRQAMIGNMVAGLAERLKSEGGDLASWMRLINAYNVLGRKMEALDAISLAKKNLENDGAAIAKLEQMAKQLESRS